MNYHYPDYHLLVMTKSPELGRVKTRMQPDFTEPFSQSLHVALADYCLSRMECCAGLSNSTLACRQSVTV